MPTKKPVTLTPDDLDRLVRMGWEDRTSFESIRQQFGLSPNETIKWMRKLLDPPAFKRWRARTRVQGHLKHEKKRPFTEGRFKCSRQRSDGSTKGWK